MKKTPTFPWRLFRWFLFQQFSISLLAVFILNFVVLAWLYSKVDLPTETLSSMREILLYSSLIGVILILAVSVWMGRSLVVPLGRLIAKTQKIRRFPFGEEVDLSADLAFDEPGEWFELERALNDLGRDLQSKTISLSREKTELRTIMSAMNEAVLAINHERRPLFYNSQFALLFRLGEMDLNDSRLSEVIRSPDILQAYERSLREGQTGRVETRLELLDKQFMFQVSVAPLRKKHNNEIYGAVAVFHDVTEMKKAEQVRIEFMGNVSHELRTPLTSIKGYLQTTIHDVEKGKTAQTMQFLQVMNRNVDRLMHLVDDLLDLSSLQTGVEIRRTKIDLKHLTQTVVGQVDCRAHELKVNLGVDHLFADESRVEQVLRNLLQNSVRYVPKGGVIEVSWLAEKPGTTELRVKDTGPGIAKEHQARLFERFYRVDVARSRQVGGSGIGLSLVKHIMQRHNGEVSVSSEVGHGAEFICTFPQ